MILLCGLTCLLSVNGVVSSQYLFKECVAWYRLVDTALTTILGMADFQYIIGYILIHFLSTTFLCYVCHAFGLNRLSSFSLNLGNCWSSQLVVFISVANFFGIFPTLGRFGKLLRVFGCFNTDWHFSRQFLMVAVLCYAVGFSFLSPNIGGFLGMRITDNRLFP